MFNNFLIEVEEEREYVERNKNVCYMRNAINLGLNPAELVCLFDDAITTDSLIVIMALELGWDDSEYRNDNSYDEEDDDAVEDYNNERNEIVDSAWYFIQEKLGNFKRKDEKEPTPR